MVAPHTASSAREQRGVTADCLFVVSGAKLPALCEGVCDRVRLDSRSALLCVLGLDVQGGRGSHILYGMRIDGVTVVNPALKGVFPDIKVIVTKTRKSQEENPR